MRLLGGNPAAGGDARQLTRFDDFDVLWPSAGAQAIVFEQGGWIWRFDPANGQAAKLDIRVTDTPITHAQDPVPGWFEAGSDGEIVARLRFASDVAPLLGDYLDRATLETRDGVTIATMRVADEFSLRRLAARRGGAVELLYPEPVRHAAADWAESALALYR